MIEYLTVAVPKYEVPRESLDQKDLADFERVTGIKKTRRWHSSTTSMVKEALLACGFDGKDIEQVIVVTQSPDQLSPSMAMHVHAILDLPKHIPAFDVNHACDGWVFGLHIALTSGRKTLLICADRLRYKKTEMEGLIFSDSVSITVVDPSNSHVPTSFYTDGSNADKLYCNVMGQMDMKGDFVFDFVTTKIPTFIKNFNSVNSSDLLVPHQANLSMNKLLAVRSGFKANWLSSIEEYGNQSMNSIPTAIVANEDRALGKSLLLCGFGAGMSATLMKIEWPKKVGFMVSI